MLGFTRWAAHEPKHESAHAQPSLSVRLCYASFMSDEKSNRKSLEDQLHELRVQIADLLRKLDTAVGKEAEALKPKLKAAQERFNELRKTSAEAWKADVRPGLGKAWDELQKSLNQAAARFKKR